MIKRIGSKRLILAACVLLATASGAAIAENAPAAEVFLLPKFCWSQYMNNIKGPQYSIPRDLCGVGMNHYCPALVELNRSMKSSGFKRHQHLVVAKRGIEYTLGWMKGYPNCPIRAQVEASSREVDSMLRFDPAP